MHTTPLLKSQVYFLIARGYLSRSLIDNGIGVLGNL